VSSPAGGRAAAHRLAGKEIKSFGGFWWPAVAGEGEAAAAAVGLIKTYSSAVAISAGRWLSPSVRRPRLCHSPVRGNRSFTLGDTRGALFFWLLGMWISFSPLSWEKNWVGTVPKTHSVRTCSIVELPLLVALAGTKLKRRHFAVLIISSKMADQ
jgi:hypothetical protein